MGAGKNTEIKHLFCIWLVRLIPDTTELHALGMIPMQI